MIVILWLDRYRNDMEVNKLVSYLIEGWVRLIKKMIVIIRGFVILFFNVNFCIFVKDIYSDYKKKKKSIIK